MEPNPLPKTKRLRKINRNRNSRPSKPGYHGSPYHHFPPAAAAIIDTNNNVLVLPQPQPLPLFPGIYPPPPSSAAYGSPPQNVEQQLSGSNDSERASYSVDPSANWMSALGQYLLRAINCAVMAGETIPPPAYLHQSIEPREETSGKEAAQFRCEVCEIDFSSKNILFEHILGNQHKEYVAKLKSGIGLLASNSTPLLLEPSPPAVTASSPPSLATSTPLAVFTPPSAIIGPHELPSVIVSSPTVIASTPPPSATCTSTQLPVSASIPADDAVITPEEPLAVIASFSPIIASSTPLAVSTKASTDGKITVPHVRCEICDIFCHKTVLEQHLLGKRHKKNLGKSKSASVGHVIANPPPIPPVSASASIDNLVTGLQGSLPVITSLPPVVAISTLSPVSTSASLDKPTAELPVRNEVCNIVCPENTILHQQLLGKTHENNLEEHKSESVFPIATNRLPAWPASSTPVKSSFHLMFDGSSQFAVSDSASIENPIIGPLVTASTHPTVATSAPLSVSTSVSIGKPIIRPEENLKKPKVFISAKSLKRVAACGKDLEAKRRRVLETGTAAEDVRVCNICNVVAPSDVVYRSHLFGRKHVARIKKLASTGGSRAI